jgi:hypothetical protein
MSGPSLTRPLCTCKRQRGTCICPVWAASRRSQAPWCHRGRPVTTRVGRGDPTRAGLPGPAGYRVGARATRAGRGYRVSARATRAGGVPGEREGYTGRRGTG